MDNPAPVGPADVLSRLYDLLTADDPEAPLLDAAPTAADFEMALSRLLDGRSDGTATPSTALDDVFMEIAGSQDDVEVFAEGLAGYLDTVAVTGGQTLPSGRIKVIQPMEIATVRAIHVREGEAVAEGQLLIEFDPTVAVSAAAQASRAAQSAKADMIRADAVLARAAAETAQAMYRETQPLIEQQLKTRRELAEKGYNSKLLVLELEAQRIERLRDAEVQAKNAERAAAAIAGIDAQLVQLKEELAR